MNNLFKPLTDDEIEEFDQLILKYANDDDLSITNFIEMDAFLTAILCSPTPIQPSQWLPRIWGANQPNWDSKEEVSRYMDYLFRCHNFVSTILKSSGEAFTAAFEEIELENGEIVAVYSDWLIVYLQGLEFLGINRLPDIIQPELDLLKQYNEEENELDVPFSYEKEVEKARRIEIAVARIYKYIREEIYLPLINQTYVREGKKIGVNDPCLCGSGKKYKKCCGRSH